jgi:hypothetical protein
MRPGKARFGLVHPALQPQGRDDGRHERLVPVVADPELDLAREVDPVDRLQESMDEVLARLLALADDVDAGVLLIVFA